MKLRSYALLFLLGLVLQGFWAKFQNSPGYMDADYYYSTGLNLAQGKGLVEYAIWNYLDDPKGLPHPSHAYWMPMASLVSAVGIRAFPTTEPFEAAQRAFVLLASFVPPLTAFLSFKIWRKEDVAKLAGWLALFSGFYSIYLSTSDTFGLSMILGAGYFYFFWRAAEKGEHWSWLFLGVVAGLLHLTRADGILWPLAGAAFLAIEHLTVLKKSGASYSAEAQNGSLFRNTPLRNMLLLVGGYLFIMTPWFWRNLNEFGVLLNPGGTKSLWLTEYNDLFRYPSTDLNFSNWQQTGVSTILADRFESLWINIQSLIAVQGLVFLVPLLVVGWMAYNRENIIRLAGLLLIGQLILMSMFFPYSGSRGGYFHAGAGLQPFLWGLASLGFFKSLAWVRSRRGWDRSQSTRVFKAAVILFAIVITASIASQKLGDNDSGPNMWDQYRAGYTKVGAALDEEDAQRLDGVMVINPPGFFIYGGRPAVAIPTGGEQAVLDAANEFSVRYLIVEINHPPEMEIYFSGVDNHGWVFYRKVAGMMIYRRVNGGMND